MLADRRTERSMNHMLGSGHSPMPSHRRQCYFSGRVQGVGFRYTVKNIVLQHNINGYVRNLPDGRVELVMEGSDTEMDQVVDAVNSRMTGFIQKVDLSTAPATGEFEYFQIRH
jgi:acylphosphatase